MKLGRHSATVREGVGSEEGAQSFAVGIREEILNGLDYSCSFMRLRDGACEGAVETSAPRTAKLFDLLALLLAVVATDISFLGVSLLLLSTPSPLWQHMSESLPLESPPNALLRSEWESESAMSCGT